MRCFLPYVKAETTLEHTKPRANMIFYVHEHSHSCPQNFRHDTNSLVNRAAVSMPDSSTCRPCRRSQLCTRWTLVLLRSAKTVGLGKMLIVAFWTSLEISRTRSYVHVAYITNENPQNFATRSTTTYTRSIPRDARRNPAPT
jgi:hypothetical protein